MSSAESVRHVNDVRALHDHLDLNAGKPQSVYPGVAKHLQKLGIYTINTSDSMLHYIRHHEEVEGVYESSSIRLNAWGPIAESPDPHPGYGFKKKHPVLRDDSDIRLRFSIFQSNLTTQINASPGLARISHGELGAAAWNYYTYDPNAIASPTIYIIDTGVQVSHQEFEGRMTRGPVFGAKDDHSPEDDIGHGTAVASLALGATLGVARAAEGVALKLANKATEDDESIWNTEDLLEALEYVINQEGDPRLKVINLSLGGSKDDALNTAIYRVVYWHEIHVVAGAGNDNRDTSDSRVGLPAASFSALVVGSIDERDEKSHFSNWGRNVRLVAPGERVNVARAGARDDETWWASGTSFSCPYVAGLVAYVLSIKGPMEPGEMSAWINRNAKTSATGFPGTWQPFVVYNGSGY